MLLTATKAEGQTTGQRQQRQRRHSAPVHKFKSWSDSRLAVFFRVPFRRLSCEEGACRFCAKWLVWDRADHISSESDRSLVGRAFGSSANSASRGVGDRPLCSGALTHGPSGQRQRQCQYRALFLPSRAAFNRGLGAAFVVVITTASGGASTAALTHRLPRASRGPVGWCAVLRHVLQRYCTFRPCSSCVCTCGTMPSAPPQHRLARRICMAPNRWYDALFGHGEHARRSLE